MTKLRSRSLLVILLLPIALIAQEYPTPEFELDDILDMSEGDEPEEEWQKRAEKDEYALLWPVMGEAGRIEGSLNLYQYKSADYRIQARHISNERLENFFILFSEDASIVSDLISEIEEESEKKVDVTAIVYREIELGVTPENAVKEVEEVGDSISLVGQEYPEDNLWVQAQDSLAASFVFHWVDDFKVGILNTDHGVYFYIVEEEPFSEYLAEVMMTDTLDYNGYRKELETMYQLIIPPQMIGQEGLHNGIQLATREHVSLPWDKLEPGVRYKGYYSFVLGEDGAISEVTVQRTSGLDVFDEKVVSDIQQIPPLFPAENNGRPVKVTCTVPFAASIQ